MTTTHYDDTLKSELDATVGRLNDELAALRSNRPSVELVQKIPVTYYDQVMAVNALGTLSIEPPRTVRIVVWDQNAVAPVVKAIQDAQVGLSVTNDGMTIRATMAELTAERREELAKTIKKVGEGTRITIRTQRDDVMKKVKAAKEAKELTEDDEFSLKEALQKRVDAANKRVDELVETKLAAIAA